MRPYFAFAAIFIIFLVGCSGKKAEVVEVVGTAKLKSGEALPELKVMFSPDPNKGPAGRSSEAITDANGEFRLRYTGGSPEFGAEVGWHIVTAIDVMAENSRDNPIPPRISQMHSLVGKSGLSFEVKSGQENNFVIELDPRN
jgi:hypothetical protein